MKTEKDRDTGRQKAGPSRPVGTISCQMDETFLSSIEPDGSSGFRHGTGRRTGSNGMRDRTIVPVGDMAETDGVLENGLMQWVDVSAVLWQGRCRMPDCRWKREKHGRRRPDGLAGAGRGG